MKRQPPQRRSEVLSESGRRRESPGFSRGEDVKKRNEPTKEQVEAAAGFLRDNLHLFGPQACFLETGHIDEIAYGMLRAAGKAAH